MLCHPEGWSHPRSGRTPDEGPVIWRRRAAVGECIGPSRPQKRGPQDDKILWIWKLCDDYCLMTGRRVCGFLPSRRLDFAAVGERGFRGGFFVDLDSPAWFFADPEISIFHFGAAVENFLRAIVEW